MGCVMENAPTEELFQNPVHPYTKALLASMPGLDRKDKSNRLVGEIGSPIDPPPGCRLASRCPVVMEECYLGTPKLREIAPNHRVACIKY